MDMDDEMQKLKVLGICVVAFLFSGFKSCETIKYKFASENAKAEVTRTVMKQGRKGGTSYHVEYLVSSESKTFPSSMKISKSDIPDYPKGLELDVLVINQDLPFPSTVVKGHETSIWFFVFVIVVLAGGAYLVMEFRKASRM